MAFISTLCYIFGSKAMVMITDSKQVIEDSVPFLPWLWVMPAVSCIAFTWDGIFIGATATKAIMYIMLIAAIGFLCILRTVKRDNRYSGFVCCLYVT